MAKPKKSVEAATPAPASTGANIVVIDEGFRIKKSEATAVDISIKSFGNNSPVLDIRQMYVDKATGDWKHTASGTTIPLEETSKLVKKLAKLIKKMQEAGRDTGE